METFNILGKSISFDEDFSQYTNIQKKKFDYCKIFSDKYNNLISKQQINTMNEFIDYISYTRKFMDEEFYSMSNEILNILSEYNIFDKSNTDIISNCRTKNNFVENTNSYMRYIKDLFSKMEQKRAEVYFEAERTANKIYQPDYIGVITSSAWVAVTTDIRNEKEEYRTERKRENFVNKELKRVDKQLTNIADKDARELVQKFQESTFNYGILAICEMFEYCVSILIYENKLSFNIKKHLQKEKANNILSNLERAQDKNVKNEQLIIAFEADPFSSEIHSKIIDYIKDDIEEYIRLVKFIKCEKTILQICQKKCTNFNNENDKFVKIINLLDEKYIKNIISKANTIEDIENSNPNINLSISKKIFYMEFNKIFEAFLYAGNIIGKIQEQDKINGHIVVKCSMSLKNILNPTTIDIKIHKQNANQAIVEISSLCRSDGAGILQSPQKWKEKLLEEVYKKLDNNVENTNKIDSNNIEKVNKPLDNNIKNVNRTVDNNVKNNPKTQIPETIYKFNNTEKLTFRNDYKYVFDVFIYASYFIGKTTKQDRINGQIIINRPLSILEMTPPTTIDIKINKIDETKTEVTISTLSKNAQILGTPLVWKKKLLEQVYKKIGNHDGENIDKDKSQECNSDPKEQAIIRKSKAKKATRKTYIIFIILLTIFNMLCGMELGAIIACDITLSIIFYPIIYLCTRLYYKNK